MFSPSRILLCLNFNLLFLSCSFFYHISSLHLCHKEESFALLGFKESFLIVHQGRTSSWKKGTDCCKWDGIKCHYTTHHVILIDLSSSDINGTIKSNNTLFLLRHLRSLNLSKNDFSSSISPKFGMFPFLRHLNLSSCSLSGEVPLDLAQLSHLRSLDLSMNTNLKLSNFGSFVNNMSQLRKLNLSGLCLNSTIPRSINNLSYLRSLDLSGCALQGEFLHYSSNRYLQKLDLSSSNNLSGKISLYKFFTKLPNLKSLSLSNSGLSVTITDGPINSSSMLANFLLQLELSNTSMRGKVPKWMKNLGRESLLLLDLSHNNLTGGLETIPWRNLHTIDISYNMLKGHPPKILSNFVRWIQASNNLFTGPMSSEYCNLTSLQVLDYCHNNLSGEFPHCLVCMSSHLTVLNLALNNIHGTLPSNLSKCGSLQYLDLSRNLMRGTLPRSLSHCTNLQDLSLRGNNFKGEFPGWLHTLPQLQVLDLSSNSFYGPITTTTEDHPYSLLRILNLSGNNFTGKIPETYVGKFLAMMKINKKNQGNAQYLQPYGIKDYYYSIILIFNGQKMTYMKIITTLANFDLSNNAFDGYIPESIGELVTIHGLNLSHNHLIGSIPRSISNLTLLNCLDLSNNNLSGEIPQELSSLTSMGVFDVSNNQLQGPIPHGNNFDTYSIDSYKGNVGLCGFPLPNCGENELPSSINSPNNGEFDDDRIWLLEWKVILMGFGCGTIGGMAWGYYMLSVGKPFWFVKMVYAIELALGL